MDVLEAPQSQCAWDRNSPLYPEPAFPSRSLCFYHGLPICPANLIFSGTSSPPPSSFCAIHLLYLNPRYFLFHSCCPSSRPEGCNQAFPISHIPCILGSYLAKTACSHYTSAPNLLICALAYGIMPKLHWFYWKLKSTPNSLPALSPIPTLCLGMLYEPAMLVSCAWTKSCLLPPFCLWPWVPFSAISLFLSPQCPLMATVATSKPHDITGWPCPQFHL